jgi:hypothetical protein
LKPFKGVSQIGDGVNDSFVIENIEYYQITLLRFITVGEFWYMSAKDTTILIDLLWVFRRSSHFNQSEELPVVLYYIFKYVDRKTITKKNRVIYI